MPFCNRGARLLLSAACRTIPSVPPRQLLLQPKPLPRVPSVNDEQDDDPHDVVRSSREALQQLLDRLVLGRAAFLEVDGVEDERVGGEAARDREGPATEEGRDGSTAAVNGDGEGGAAIILVILADLLPFSAFTHHFIATETLRPPLSPPLPPLKPSLSSTCRPARSFSAPAAPPE